MSGRGRDWSALNGEDPTPGSVAVLVPMVAGYRTDAAESDAAVDPATLANRWSEAGLVVNGQVSPLVLAMVALALHPHRQVVIDRTDGRRTSRITVGWEPDGRAAITDQGPDQTVAITATRMELLPALVLQSVRLHGAIPEPEGREPIRTTGRMIDGRVAVAADKAAAGDPLDAVLAHWDHGFHAVGAWQQSAVDAVVRVIDCGPLGLWEVQVGDSTGPDDPVTLVPATRERIIGLLGDVVTGRGQSRPGQTVEDR